MLMPADTGMRNARRGLGTRDARRRLRVWGRALPASGMLHWRTGMATVQAMLIEFGPAELVDSFLARPLLMYLMPGLLNDLTTGIVAGKLAADVVFYAIVISAYELRQRHDRELPGPGGHAGSSTPTPTPR